MQTLLKCMMQRNILDFVQMDSSRNFIKYSVFKNLRAIAIIGMHTCFLFEIT